MIKKISVHDLRLGMTVARMQSDIWFHSPTLYTQEGPIVSEKAIRDIIDQGYTEVFIDTGTDAGASQKSPALSFAPRKRTPFSDELVTARKVYAQTLQVARELFMAAAKGQQLDVDATAEAVDHLQGSIDRNPGALGCLARLSGADAYLYAHSVNVAVLAMFAGQGTGLTEQDVRMLGMAGLFHDLGKTRLPIGLLNRRVPLTPEESRLMETHSEHGLAILEASADVPGSVKRAVAEHHERYDGEGYPFGLEHGKISRLGRLLALANCFDFLVSKRTYKDALPPSKALSIMYGMRGKDFAADEVDQFIKEVGVYPAGSLVKLSTGEVAVVCETDAASPLAPMVSVVLDPALNPATPYLRDLSREGDSDGCRVVEYLDVRDLSIDPLEIMLSRYA